LSVYPERGYNLVLFFSLPCRSRLGFIPTDPQKEKYHEM